MHAEPLIVQVTEFQSDGNAVRRCQDPGRAMSRIPGVTVVDCDPYHHLLPPLLDIAHIVLFHGFDADYIPLIERRRETGQVTLFDFNDDYYDIQPFNPRSARWVERVVRNDLRHFMSAVDAVQFSSGALAARYADGCRRAATFPNQLADLPPPRVPVDRPLTIGWAGSVSHLADWFDVAPAVQRWLDVRPDVRVAVMADEAAHGFLRLPPERYQARREGSLRDYLEFIQDIDIGLAPLLPTAFGTGRTDLKFLEYASGGVAGIYADVGPFRATVTDGVTGLLYADAAGLVACLDRLADDASLRAAIAAAARDHVAAHRMIGPEAARRVQYYRGLLGPRLDPVPLGDEVIAAAVAADGRYVRLDRGPPELGLAEALRHSDGRERTHRLEGLLARCPGYLAGLQALGRQYNDAREFASAGRTLESALAIEPTSARTLLEIGRSRLGAGDLNGGREYLKAAVRVNPRFQPAWRALFDVLAIAPDDAATEGIERALDIFPDDFALAIRAARAVPRPGVLGLLARAVAAVGGRVEPYERTAVATAFSAAAAALSDRLAEPEVVAFLERLSTLIPESARLHDLLGHAYHLSGDTASSCDRFRRAVELRRAAAIYRSEFPDEGTTQQIWLAGEYAARTRTGGVQDSEG